MSRNILVVCSGNICRSPMAEGILRSLVAGEDVELRSAGTLEIVGAPAADNAVLACRDRGVDIAKHRSSALHADLLDWADVVLAMEVSHVEACRYRAANDAPRLLLLGQYGSAEGPEIADPVGQDLDAFKRCRDILFTCSERFVRDELGIDPNEV